MNADTVSTSVANFHSFEHLVGYAYVKNLDSRKQWLWILETMSILLLWCASDY